MRYRRGCSWKQNRGYGDAGPAGFGLTSHYVPTAERAADVTDGKIAIMIVDSSRLLAGAGPPPPDGAL